MPDNVDSVVLVLPGDEDFRIDKVGSKLGSKLAPELRRRWGLDRPDDDEPVSSFNNFI